METNHQAVVVLVEPSGNINVGSVARLCKNFGIKELRLVAPKCETNSREAIQMAVKGKQLLQEAKEYSNLLEATSDCSKVIATAGRKEQGRLIPLHQSKETFKWAAKAYGEGPIALVFGREDSGLNNEELLLAQRIITLNTSTDYQSLNLSHAVAIILNDFIKYKYNNSDSNLIIKKSDGLAKVKELNDCLIDAQDVLLEIGFLLQHTSKARMAKFKGLLQRAGVKSEEVALIRGIVRQIRWAITK